MAGYTLQFTDEARQDINLAFVWYEEKRKGLGLDFLLFLRAVSNAIQSNPLQFQAISYDKSHIRRPFSENSTIWSFTRLKTNMFLCLAY